MNKEGKNGVTTNKKIFVLDTSVILYDHDAFLNFQEHDVAIPVQVLEELDNKKSGNDTRNFEARSFLRMIDDISKNNLLNQWTPLNGKSKGSFKVIMNDKSATNAELVFGSEKTDHRILNAALSLQEEYPAKKVILVSKDICLRLKAKSLNINAEDYETGKVKNVDALYTGATELDKVTEKLIGQLNKQECLSLDELDGHTYTNNHFYILKGKKNSVPAFYNAHSQLLEKVTEQPVLNIAPRNIEQSFAIYALLHPDIKLVTIQGNAGTGKTLLALASALEQRK
ncbi:MAG: ribonuclease, partial [Sphingobacteriales bacterium]